MGALDRGEDLPSDAALQDEPLPGSGREWRIPSAGTSGRKTARRAAIRFALFATASAAMYLTFFGSIDQLFPLLTAGSLVGAAAVIGLALVFCLIHGACANYLLELLGIRELR